MESADFVQFTFPYKKWEICSQLRWASLGDAMGKEGQCLGQFHKYFHSVLGPRLLQTPFARKTHAWSHRRRLPVISGQPSFGVSSLYLSLFTLCLPALTACSQEALEPWRSDPLILFNCPVWNFKICLSHLRKLLLLGAIVWLMCYI